MALKRINKELTDLGRYVDLHLFTATRLSWGCYTGGVLEKITNNVTFEV